MQPLLLNPHLTEREIVIALDPNGGGDAGAAARAHAAGCLQCAAALAAAEAAEREVEALLQLLDHPVPIVDPAHLATRARASTPATPRARRVHHADGTRDGTDGAPRHRHARWAAGLAAVGIAAVAAAVAPRSPLRELVARAWSTTFPSHTVEAPPPQVTSPPSSTSTSASRGVAIMATGSVDIIFRSRQPAGIIRIVTRPDAHVAVTASGDGATYTVGQDTIVIDNHSHGADSLNYDVALPPEALLPAVRVYVGPGVVYRRGGEQVSGPRAPGTGRETRGGAVISFARLPR